MISRNLVAAVVMLFLVSEAAPLLARECLLSLGRYARGWSEAVAANGSEFVFDISDPGEPLQIADTVMPGEEHAVMLDGGEIYVADSFGGLGVYSGRRCLLHHEMPPEDPASSTR